MKPSGPLRRGKPVARSTGLARGTLKRSRKPIKPMSDKRAGELEQRTEVRRAVIRRDGFCVARTVLPSVACDQGEEVHEPESRGRFPGRKAWLDPDRCVLLCGAHHRYVTSGHNSESVALGLLCEQGSPTWSAEAWRAEHLGQEIRP